MTASSPATVGAVRVEITIDDREAAARLAAGLVAERLAACVQTNGPITSTYRWDGAVTTGEEWLLVAKTAADRLDALVAYVREHHPYDVPEVLAVPVAGGNPEYLAWLVTETRPAET